MAAGALPSVSIRAFMFFLMNLVYGVSFLFGMFIYHTMKYKRINFCPSSVLFTDAYLSYFLNTSSLYDKVWLKEKFSGTVNGSKNQGSI